MIFNGVLQAKQVNKVITAITNTTRGAEHYLVITKEFVSLTCLRVRYKTVTLSSHQPKSETLQFVIKQKSIWLK